MNNPVFVPWSDKELTVTDDNQHTMCISVYNLVTLKYDASYGIINVKTTNPLQIDLIRPSEAKNGLKLKIIGPIIFQGERMDTFEAMYWREKWWFRE